MTCSTNLLSYSPIRPPRCTEDWSRTKSPSNLKARQRTLPTLQWNMMIWRLSDGLPGCCRVAVGAVNHCMWFPKGVFPKFATMFPAASAQMINVFSFWLFQCPNTHSTRVPPNIILTLLFSLPVLWIRYNLFLSLLPVCVRSLSWLQLPCGWPVWVGHPLKTQQHPISLKVDYGATRLHLIYFMNLCTHTNMLTPAVACYPFPFSRHLAEVRGDSGDENKESWLCCCLPAWTDGGRRRTW